MTERRIWGQLIWVAPLFFACSGSGDGGAGNGGSSASGGASVGNGGASNGGSVTAAGGAAPGGSSNGGASSGGASNGGASNGGAASAQGGLANSGGASNGGATSAQGGLANSGGASTGGSSAKGGAAGSGTGGGSAGSASSCPTDNETKFSFYLISNAALIRESGNANGFGGDLGGLSGADAICQRVAEYVSPCQSSKVWHAFLSTTTANAIDRVGTGPWYDRNGRLVSQNLTNLVMDRPGGADAAIKNDLPNENGTPNHRPDGSAEVDNHEILTGTGTDGKLYTQSASAGTSGSATSCGPDVGASGAGAWSADRATCWNWTRKTNEGCPRVGHSWPGQGSGTNWMSVWNEGGCAPGGTLVQTGGLDGTRRVGSAGGYGGFYCVAVIPHP
ncbi:MAG: hypothetical protein QM756_26105 [Polyangiaceae bacterium]